MNHNYPQFTEAAQQCGGSKAAMGMLAGTNPVEKASQIERQKMVMDGQIGELMNQLDVLTSRLNPILRLEEPVPCGDGKMQEECLCGHADFLRGQNRRLNNILSAMVGLMARIEL